MDTTSTFQDNMKLPVHRWFRYPAGFSAVWAGREIYNRFSASGLDSNFAVLDPFAGSATTLLAAEQVGVKAFGFESHPLVARIANAKLLWHTSSESVAKLGGRIVDIAKNTIKQLDTYPSVVLKCYTKDNLTAIDSIKSALFSVADSTPEYQICWLAFLSILRPASQAGTATWQYLLPNKKKARVADAYDAFENQISMICNDMSEYRSSCSRTDAVLFTQDARQACSGLRDSIDFVITSPPYANNYDYADATRLELSVLGEIDRYADLQTKIRTNLVRSCTQMCGKEAKRTFDILQDPNLTPIRSEIVEVCERMLEEKSNHAGAKNYHTMIALYFSDLAKVFINLRAVCKNGSSMCWVIGDSAPYGVYVPVDEWLGRLAVAAGFKGYTFEKTRDRNIKWKNRKHRVPLKEGRLWIEG